VAGFTDVVRALCAHLGITKLAAVVGISGGGPSAVTMAARHPELVERLILHSAVGWVPWPDRHIRIGARTFANFGLVALDVAPITIGDDAQIGSNVQVELPYIASDMRFMQGVYRGVDGKPRQGTFGFI